MPNRKSQQSQSAPDNGKGSLFGITQFFRNGQFLAQGF